VAVHRVCAALAESEGVGRRGLRVAAVSWASCATRFAQPPRTAIASVLRNRVEARAFFTRKSYRRRRFNRIRAPTGISIGIAAGGILLSIRQGLRPWKQGR